MSISDFFIYTGETSVALIVWSFYVAIVIGTIIMYLTKVKFGKLVYALLDKNASTPETAITVEETGVKLGFFIKLCLKNHLNYKDLLVAITEDGKYYANSLYSDAVPSIKTLKTITRIRKSRVRVRGSAPEQSETESTEQASEALQAPDTAQSTEQSTPAPSPETPDTPVQNDIDIYKKPEKPSFNVAAARYYIPTEVHAKVMSIYNEKGFKLRWIILALIGLAVVAYFATFLLDEILYTLGTLN